MIILVNDEQKRRIDDFEFDDNIFNLENVIKSRHYESSILYITIITDPSSMDSNINGVVKL